MCMFVASGVEEEERWWTELIEMLLFGGSNKSGARTKVYCICTYITADFFLFLDNADSYFFLKYLL